MTQTPGTTQNNPGFDNTRVEEGNKGRVGWEVERVRQGVKHRLSKSGAAPEDYQADLQQICPPGQLDQRLDRDQWSA